MFEISKEGKSHIVHLKDLKPFYEQTLNNDIETELNIIKELPKNNFNPSTPTKLLEPGEINEKRRITRSMAKN